MKKPYGKAVQLMCKEVKALQERAHTLDDICDWLKNNPELLRQASKELGHKPPNDFYDSFGMPVNLYNFPAAVHDFKMSGLDSVAVMNKGSPYMDKLSVYYQVNIKCSYSTDPTIALELLFESIPELGIKTNEPNNSANSRVFVELFLLPTKWPLAAATLLHHLNHEANHVDLHDAKRIIDAAFPSTDWNTYITFRDMGYFQSRQELCDWLINSEYQSKNIKPDTQVDLPKDMDM